MLYWQKRFYYLLNKKTFRSCYSVGFISIADEDASRKPASRQTGAQGRKENLVQPFQVILCHKENSYMKNIVILLKVTKMVTFPYLCKTSYSHEHLQPKYPNCLLCKASGL
jgi:hypothetical protein